MSVMLGKEEGAGLELHQRLPVADRPKLQHQDRVVVSESREKTTIQRKTTIQKERRKAIRSALRDVREPEQQAAGIGNRYAA